jgi:hypothetical protein
MNLIKKIYTHLTWRINYVLKITLPQFFLSCFLQKRIKTGPFAGMQYVRTSVGSVILPKLIGTYENELFEIFKKISHINYKCFIDIGAAEGFYVVGIKKYILTGTNKVIAFEASKKGRRLVKKIARLNNVNGMIIKGFCDVGALRSVLNNENTFILADIEGGEYNLLDPDVLDFSDCDLLVEMHHDKSRNKEELFIQKFSSTHNITPIAPQDKNLPANISWHPLIKKYSNYAINEFRESTSWLFLQRKNAL